MYVLYLTMRKLYEFKNVETYIVVRETHMKKNSIFRCIFFFSSFLLLGIHIFSVNTIYIIKICTF